MLVYTKLWLLLEEKGMKRTDLLNIMSSATLAKLGKNEAVSSTIIEKICEYLNCQPGDIMENLNKQELIKAGEALNQKMEEMIKSLEVATGMSREVLFNEFMKEAPKMLETFKNGETDFLGIEKLKETENKEENQE